MGQKCGPPFSYKLLYQKLVIGPSLEPRPLIVQPGMHIDSYNIQVYSCVRVQTMLGLNSATNLPSFLVVRGTKDQGRGLFTKKSIKRGKRIFASPPYSFGIGGITIDDTRALCHHCFLRIRSGDPVVCSDCKVVSYCSRECLAAALPLHIIECNKVARLEKLRGSEQYRIVEQDDLRSYWPPNVSLLVAHLINKKALHCEQSEGSFIGVHDLALLKTIPLPREVFDILKQCVRYLAGADTGGGGLRGL